MSGPARRKVVRFRGLPGSLRASVGSIVRERGITSAVRAAFAEARGQLWLIGGHEHENRDRQVMIPRGENVMNAWITAGNRTSWGKENPGYLGLVL